MIDLTRETLVSETREGQHVWTLRITASYTQGGPCHLFVFHAAMDDDQYEGDVFEAVASAQQMYEIPAIDPGSETNGQLVPYYRRSELVWYARTPSEAEELWQAITDDVDDLTRSLEMLNRMMEQETYISTGG